MKEDIIWNYKSFDELTKKELHDIIRSRIQVFVLEQNCIYQDVDNKDLYCEHLWATINDEIVAYARIVPRGVSYENEYSIGRVLTCEKHRGKGLGIQLIKNAVEIIENKFDDSAIIISAQLYLKSFYESFGFEQVSQEYLEANIPHIKMLKK